MRCIALLSGGLDSQLAIRIMQEQGIEVEAVNFKTTFTCCQDKSAQTAAELGVRLTILAQRDDYLDVIRNPMFGYGRGANPCVDCRIYMFQLAAKAMRQLDAQFVVSGEVVGQRPMSQKRRDLDVISHHSQLHDLLLRPLSAKLLPATRPEREGWVDRNRLYGFFGRGRKGLIRLARQLGLKDIPSPSSGCALTEKQFGRKVFDLVQHRPAGGPWDFELLKLGRHFRFDDRRKVIVGRREQENTQLEYLHRAPGANSSALLLPAGFPGPVAMIVGLLDQTVLDFAVGLVVRYTKSVELSGRELRLESGEETSYVAARPHPLAAQIVTVATISPAPVSSASTGDSTG